jgi:hypothetical protein
MQPWQEKLWADIETGGLKPGEMMIMAAGRNVGKTMFSSQAAIDRLMRDLMNQPIEELKLLEGRVHGARYHCVEPIGGNWREMEEWCFKQFGDVGNNIGWRENENPQCYRWYMNNRTFFFRNEADRTMFILRWSVS